jgi:hypothetical protein
MPLNGIVEVSVIITFFSDWACGGQWNRMVQFLAVLIQTVQTSHIELAVFFNGCLEQQRMTEWIRSQQEVRKKINQVQIYFNDFFCVLIIEDNENNESIRYHSVCLNNFFLVH